MADKTNHNERFRNDFIARIANFLQPEQLRNVIHEFDIVQNDYLISRRKTEIIPVGGMPEVVKCFLASKAIENASKGTLKQYRYKLLDFFDVVKKPVQAINTNDIRMYLYGFKQNRNASDRYVESVRITINGFFRWLVTNDYLIRNPCDKVEKIRFQPKRREPLATIDLEVLRYSCTDIREKAIVDFLFSTGCRVSECADVRLSDIDWLNRSVNIRHGKGDKQRIVYFNAESELSLRKYIETRKDSNDALFVSMRSPHNRIGSHAIEDIIAKIGKRNGLHVYPHMLRHTFATSGLRGGTPLEKLQLLMGHSRPETTLIYAKQFEADIQAEHRRVYA